MKADRLEILPQEALQTYRGRLFRLPPEPPVRSRDEAVEFVNHLGFVYFWPITGVMLPSLWVAVAGARPVADAHDDPGHVTWGWKDELLGGSAWYYAKVLRKKATLISFQAAPYFYALSENYGAPESDYLTQYEQGRLTQEAKNVYQALLDEGPLDTLALRRAARLANRENESRFERALADLQADFKIVPVGVRDVGAWHYAFAYDLVARRYPDLPEQARWMGEKTAREYLAERFIRMLGAVQVAQVARLFGWKVALAQAVLDELTIRQKLLAGVAIDQMPGKWYVHPEVVNPAK